MKPLRYLTVLSFVTAALSGFAINSHAAPPESGDSEGKPPASKHHEPGDKADSGARGKWMAAMRQAKTDPAVMAAQKTQGEAEKAYRDALKSAILAKDSSLAPLLAKMGPGPGARPPKGEGEGKGGDRMSPEDRQKLRTAREEAEKAPAVQEAAKKRDAANTALRAALKSAIVKIDPTLEATADKMLQKMGGPRGERGGERPHRRERHAGGEDGGGKGE